MNIIQLIQILALIGLYCWAVPMLLSTNAIIPNIIGIIIAIAPIVYFLNNKDSDNE